MRIALISTSLNQGGAEQQVFDLATAFAARGHAVLVVSMIEPKYYAAELQNRSVRVETLHMRPGIPNPLGLFRLVSLLRKFRPDVVHAHMFHANILARIARPFFYTPLICTAHNTQEVSQRGNAARGTPYKNIAYRLSDFLCTLTTQISVPGYNAYIANRCAPSSKLRLVYNGVDLKRFERQPPITCNDLGIPIPPGVAFVWLHIGRHVPQKDHENLFAAIDRSKSSSVFLFVGEGPLLEANKSRAAALGVAHRVFFLGRRNDIPALIKACNGVVLSSEMEGLPLSVIEASASERIVVSTDVGGVRDTLPQTSHEWLCAAKCPEALAPLLQRAEALPPEARERIGLLNKQHASEHFAIGSVASQWERIYHEVST